MKYPSLQTERMKSYYSCSIVDSWVKWSQYYKSSSEPFPCIAAERSQRDSYGTVISLSENTPPGQFLSAQNPIKALCMFLTPRGLFGRWYNPSMGTAAAQTLTSLALVWVLLRSGCYRPHLHLILACQPWLAFERRCVTKVYLCARKHIQMCLNGHING